MGDRPRKAEDPLAFWADYRVHAFTPKAEPTGILMPPQAIPMLFRRHGTGNGQELSGGGLARGRLPGYHAPDMEPTPTARALASPEGAAVIVSRRQIQRRLDELAGEIAAVYAGCELTVVGILDGALVFLADLVRRLDIDLRIITLSVRSYSGNGLLPGGPVISGVLPRLEGRHVLVVDDILDTGSTLSAVLAQVGLLNPASCRCCVLLRKHRRAQGPASAPKVEFAGFDIEDRFVVGYGLDFDGKYRNLSDIVVLKQHWE
jgi:hypoxanthine phosphoribosyltransferase